MNYVDLGLRCTMRFLWGTCAGLHEPASCGFGDNGMALHLVVELLFDFFLEFEKDIAQDRLDGYF